MLGPRFRWAAITGTRDAGMNPLDSIRDRIQWLTFDCYGTLVDWDAGIRQVLARVTGMGGKALDALVEAYIRHEACIEAGPFLPYKNVQARALRALADERGFSLVGPNADILSRTLPDWPPFTDSRAALSRLKSRYKLGVLSNVDRDLFAGTQQRLGVEFDLLVTAEDVRSYKPAHGHFARMLGHVDGDRSKVLHVAQSLFHDAVPASELDLPYVWINRYGGRNETGVAMLAEFDSLAALADALGV